MVATNENNVLDEFFRTGAYRVRGREETHKTSSPSMDISKASNFERFVFDLLERDASELNRLWQQVAENGVFDLAGSASFDRISSFGFVSGSSTHQNRLATIARTYERYERIVDTHTADGLFVAEQWREPGVPMICLETALPVKFAERSLKRSASNACPAQARHLAEAAQRFCWLPRSVPALKEYIVRHSGRASMNSPIFGFAGYSGSGKTTLIEQLIPKLVEMGLAVSLIKHAHHSFDI